jgi:hypothetical protein
MVGVTMAKKFEPLFKSDTDWHNNACLNFSHSASIGYTEGYKRAANILVAYINETARDQDFLVFPIVFLYRHHLELLLKNIIDSGAGLLDAQPGYPKNHKLHILWPLAKELIRKIEPGVGPDAFDLIDHVVNELSKVDPGSMSFRYDRDTRGGKSVPQIRHVNLRHFVDGVETGIRYYLECKYESGL